MTQIRHLGYLAGMMRASILSLLLVSGCTFVLDRELAPGELRGMAVAVTSAGRRPLPSVVVTVRGTRYAARTDEAGRFVIRGLRAGTWDLTLDGELAGDRIGARVRGVTLLEADGLDLGAVVVGAFGTIEGSVTRAGSAVEGAVVATDWPEPVRTDTAGHFALVVPPGDWDLRAASREGEVASPRPVVVKAREVVKIDLPLDEARRLSDGFVSGFAAQLGVKPPPVLMLSLEAPDGSRRALADTDADGAYRSPDPIPGGLWRIVARAPDGASVRHFPVFVDGDTRVPDLILFATTDLDDDDDDGVLDVADLCPLEWDPRQENLDRDTLGDACDPDRDGDGIPNEEDGPVGVTLAAEDTVVSVGGSLEISATVRHDSNQAVTWSVVESGGGVIVDGRYTAPGVPGTYTIRAVAVADPAADATLHVEVIALPAPQLSAPEFVTVGRTVVVEVAPEVDVTYAWRIENGELVTVTDAGATVKATAMGTLTLQCVGTNRAGDEGAAFVEIEAVAMPAPVLQAPQVITAGEDVQVTLEPVAGETYRWEVTNGEIVQTTATGVKVKAGVPGTLTVRCFGTNAAGDEGEAQLVVDVVPDPVIDAMSFQKNPIVVGETTTLTFAWTAGAGATAVLNPGALDVSAGGPVPLSPTVTTEYELVVTTAAGRSASRKATLTFVPGKWRTVPVDAAPRSGHTATLLTNGRVLLAGGGNATAQIYDPVSDTFTDTANTMRAPRADHGAIRLSNGKVLICGGANCDVFDPATSAFSPGPVLAAARNASAWAPLPGDRMLLAGGLNNAVGVDSLEIVDPAAGTSQLITAKLPAPVGGCEAVALPDGRVVITGGVHQGTVSVRTVVYDPGLGTVTTAGDLGLGRTDFILVRDGNRALAIGGLNGFYIPTIDILDPVTLTWTSRNTGTARRSAAAVIDAQGHLLVSGGTATGGAKTTAWWLDLDANLQTTLAPLDVAKAGHSMTLLDTGDVLVVGAGSPAALVWDADAVP